MSVDPVSSVANPATPSTLALRIANNISELCITATTAAVVLTKSSGSSVAVANAANKLAAAVADAFANALIASELTSLS
jgi:hypothetical protein